MVPVGLDGIQKIVENMPELTVAYDDRVAIIVKNNFVLSDECKQQFELNFYSESKEIVRGVYNVIPVTMAKGLEFEKVIVIQSNMSENEFYVACTRAISELYVIPDKCGNILARYKKHLSKSDTTQKHTAILDEPGIKGTVTIVPAIEEEIQSPLAEVRTLETYVFDNTRTVELMDRFEGIGSGKPYERLIIKNAFYVSFDLKSECVNLVVERSKSKNYVGDITFTEFKKGETANLRHFIENQFPVNDLEKYKSSGEFFEFEQPYLLRAQNSRNRRGYGWEWDWSDPYDPMVTEGTLYGETTNYVFTGIYVGRR